MSERRPDLLNEGAATLAIAVFSAACALGFARVFDGWGFLANLLVVVAVGHGVSLAGRIAKLPGPVTSLAVLVALTWLVLWLNLRSTFAGVFPSGDTLRAVQDELRTVGEQFRTSVAPVEYSGGWATLALAGTAIAVFLADMFAFFAKARGESLVPGGVLFVFVAAVGTDRSRIALTLFVIAAGVVTVAVLRLRDRDTTRTVLGSRRSSLSTGLPAAMAAAGLVAVLAGLVGPHLPGAGEEPLVKTQGQDSGPTTVTSPIVDIRSRLVNQSDTELFTVAANEPSYWRLVALPQFDGERWQLPDRSLEKVEGTLADAPPGSTEIRQTTTIEALDGAFVPAAPQPTAASPGDDLRYNADTVAIVKVDGDVSAGSQYQIVSARPSFSAEQLRTTTSDDPPDPEYLELPDSLPPVVNAQATAVTAQMPTTYDKVIALQNWFRSEFTYTTNIPAGHGNSAIVQFLDDRRGYCEQFAGTFAAMARSLGIPARVAVGFTQGQLGPDGTYSVLGKNTHAWPEIWFDGLGWVPFEPTPGRGAPGTESYTGVPPQQEGQPPPTTTTTTPPTTTAPPDGAQVPPPPPPPTTPSTTTTTSPPPPVDASSGVALWWLWIVLALALVAFLIYLPALVRHWRRRHRYQNTVDHMERLWDRALIAVRTTGVGRLPTMTPLEFAAAAGATLPGAASPLDGLARVATRVTYGSPDDLDRIGHDTSDDGLAAAERWVEEIEQITDSMMSTVDRVKRHFTTWC